MKRNLLMPALLAVTLVMYACSTALKTNGVVITTADAGMQVWAGYTQTHKVSAAQILTVSNAYVAYYNSELVLSNAFMVAVTQTNNSLLQTLTQTANQSQANLIAIIQEFTK